MTRQIYVAVLADYTAGSLLGEWIDVEGKSADDIQTEVNALMRKSKHPNVLVDCPESHETCPHEVMDDGTESVCDTCKGTGKVPSAEEWAIHDHEGLGKISEYTSFEKIAELDALIEEHGDVYLAYIDDVGDKYATESDFQDRYRGEWDSFKAYVENYIDECMEVPEHLTNYIDTDAVQRDLEHNFTHSDLPNGNVAVFSR